MKRLVATLIFVLLAGAVWQAIPADVLQAQDVLQTPRDAGPAADDYLPSEGEIRDLLVEESIARYTGRCACPYSVKSYRFIRRRFGQRERVAVEKCGDNSEYVRPGGPDVFCYRPDVPAEMVEERRKHLRSDFLTEPLPKF